jgi:hypothetical protein
MSEHQCSIPQQEKPMKSAHALACLVAACIFMAGCGSKVKGHTFQDNGGVVKIEFKSGAKAFVSTGPVTNTCSYKESSRKVNLVCDGDTTVLTVEEDGALSGPPNGFLARLTPVKD